MVHVRPGAFPLLLVCIVLASASPAGNLIRNSSFELLAEDGVPVGWTPSTNAEAVSIGPRSAYHGRIGLRLALDGKTTLLGQSEYFELVPGRRYTFSAYVRAPDLEPVENLQVQIINLGWSFAYQTLLPIKRNTAEWTRFSKTFVCPPAGKFKYKGGDNVLYKVVVYAKGAKGEVEIDALQLEEGASPGEYAPRQGERPEGGDPVFEAIAASLEGRSLKRAEYFQVEDPLFGELLGDEPGPDRVLYYGYEDVLTDEVYRPYAKKFGHRYVLQEQVEALRSRPFVPMTNAWPRGGVGSYATMRMILRPDAPGIAPEALGTAPWIMDPRWQAEYIRKALELAEQSLDNRPENAWGNSWGLWAGDEVFESAGIKVVPDDKRYDEVHAIDREIKQKFGFGKYGIPDSPLDRDPFKRIAFRRWVNAKLTETYEAAYALVKKTNPDLVMLGPDPCGGVPPVDLEAMTPHFDLVTNQSWYSPRSFTQQLATGADTKAMVDLSACPVWALVQHFAASDPEALREQFSQVYRNGGEGLVILGVEWYDRELEHPQFINPAKWRALLEIADTVTKMNKVRLPEPDTAVLYASDTYLTLDSPKMADPKHPQVYAAYATLGPCVGSWFSFVSDRQIDRGQRDLGGYRVLYIPFATYLRSSVLDRIREYAQSGGTVVCTDPTAATWDINGEELSSRWEALTGLRRGKARTSTTVAATNQADAVLAEQIALRFPAPGLSVTPTHASVKPLATFADGSIAAVVRPFGKGRIITFAADPFASTDKSSAFIRLFRGLQQSVGARTDLDIWRLKLPPLKTLAAEETSGSLCLTGNFVVRGPEGIKPGRNLATGGTYTYDRFPTGIADVVASGQIPFAEGHLTNRPRAYAARKLGGARSPASPEKWIASWTDAAPVELTADLRDAYALERVRIFYSGCLPAVTVSGSLDARTWQELGSNTSQGATTDVPDVTIPVDGTLRYVRVRFAGREVDASMEIAELEIWGHRGE